MRNRIRFIMAPVFICISITGYAQYGDTLQGIYFQSHQESLPDKKPSLSITNYFQLLGDDFTRQAMAPFHSNGGDGLKVAGFALLTAGVMHFDEHVDHLAINYREKSGFLRTVSPIVTTFGGRNELYTIGAIGAWSYLFKNQQLKNATLLATQAYITSGIWVSVIKFISGRARPSYYNPVTHENEIAWHGMFFQFKKNSSGLKPDGSEFSSFPSGHSTVAFAVATVYAEVYKDKPWIQVIAYSSASLVALSRITENKHWASDVLVGSALGYLCGKQVVRNYLRNERLNSVTHKKKNMLSLNLNYNNRVVMPELIYTFR